jgi:zinc protease
MKCALWVCAALVLAAGRLTAQQALVSESRVAGVPVIFEPAAGNEVVAVRLYLKGGSTRLTPGTAGIERLIGALGSHGTARFTKDQFAARVARTGALVGSEVTRDYSVFTLRAVREYWGESWDLFVQAALHPTFPDTELTLVRGQVVNDLRQREDDPDALLGELGDSVFYAGNPYAVDPEGTVAAVTALRRDDLVRWHRQRMTKANLVLVVVGNVARADLEAKVAAAFGGLPAGGGSGPSVAPLAARGAALALVPRPLPTTYIMGLFSAPNAADADYAAMRVAIDILTKRLFDEVRTKRNLSYAPAAWMNNVGLNAGALYVTAVAPDTTLKVMRHEVERLKTEPIAPQRLAQTVNGFLTNYFLQQEANMGQAATLGRYELVGHGWRRADSFIARVRAVTPADVQRVARTYLHDFRFAVVGDSAKVDRALFTSM